MVLLSGCMVGGRVIFFELEVSLLSMLMVVLKVVFILGLRWL